MSSGIVFAFPACLKLYQTRKSLVKQRFFQFCPLRVSLFQRTLRYVNPSESLAGDSEGVQIPANTLTKNDSAKAKFTSSKKIATDCSGYFLLIIFLEF